MLVVDDVAVVRKSIRTTLVNAGYDVVEAENDKQAISVMQEMERSFPVDVILCDLRMPPLNGADLVTHFRRRHPTIPVVVLTAYPDVELAVSLMRQGVLDFLVKPVLQNELLSVVKRAVAQNAARSERGVSVQDGKREVEP